MCEYMRFSIGTGEARSTKVERARSRGGHACIFLDFSCTARSYLIIGKPHRGAGMSGGRTPPVREVIYSAMPLLALQLSAQPSGLRFQWLIPVPRQQSTKVPPQGLACFQRGPRFAGPCSSAGHQKHARPDGLRASRHSQPAPGESAQYTAHVGTA